MPSDIAIKITNAWFTHDIKEDVLPQEQMASLLDSMGVGDAFDACKCVAEDVWPNKTAKKALRKAGMV